MLPWPRILAPLPLLLALCACVSDLELNEGKIPQEALPLLEKHLGNYMLHLGERSSRARLSVSPDNMLTLQIMGDLLGDHCNSAVGALTRVTTETVNNITYIRRAAFQFSPGACSDSTAGNTLEFDIDENNAMQVAILQHVERAHRCDYWTPPSGIPSNMSHNKKTPPSYGCRLEYIPFYLRGAVERIP